jgi:hypothetical protein
MHDSPGFVHLRRSALPAPTHHCPRRNSGHKHKPLRKRNKTDLYIDDLGVICVPMLQFVLLRRIASGNQSFIFDTKTIFVGDCTITFWTRNRVLSTHPKLPQTGFAHCCIPAGGGIVRTPCGGILRSGFCASPVRRFCSIEMDVTSVEISVGCGSAECSGCRSVDSEGAAQAMVNQKGEGMTPEQRERTIAEYLQVITDSRFGGIQFEKCFCRKAAWRIKEGEKPWTAWCALSRRRQHFKKILDRYRGGKKDGSEKRSRDEAVQDRGAASEGPCKRLAPSGTQASSQTAAGEGQAREYPRIPPVWHAADMQQQGPLPGPVGSGAGDAEASAAGERMRAEIQHVLFHAWPPSVHILYSFFEREKTRFQTAPIIPNLSRVFSLWKVTPIDRIHLRRTMVQDIGELLPRHPVYSEKTVGHVINVIVRERFRDVGDDDALRYWDAHMAPLVQEHTWNTQTSDTHTSDTHTWNTGDPEHRLLPSAEFLDAVDEYLNFYRGIILDACAPASSMGIFFRMPSWLAQLVVSILTYHRSLSHILGLF